VKKLHQKRNGKKKTRGFRAGVSEITRPRRKTLAEVSKSVKVDRGRTVTTLCRETGKEGKKQREERDGVGWRSIRGAGGGSSTKKNKNSFNRRGEQRGKRGVWVKFLGRLLGGRTVYINFFTIISKGANPLENGKNDHGPFWGRGRIKTENPKGAQSK